MQQSDFSYPYYSVASHCPAQCHHPSQAAIVVLFCFSFSRSCLICLLCCSPNRFDCHFNILRFLFDWQLVLCSGLCPTREIESRQLTTGERKRATQNDEKRKRKSRLVTIHRAPSTPFPNACPSHSIPRKQIVLRRWYKIGPLGETACSSFLSGEGSGKP